MVEIKIRVSKDIQIFLEWSFLILQDIMKFRNLFYSTLNFMISTKKLMRTIHHLTFRVEITFNKSIDLTF